MRFSFQREPFSGAFQTAAAFTSTRSPKPILQNVKLELGENGAALVATDTELGVRVKVSEFEFDQPGQLILPVTRFGALLRESTDDSLTMETDGSSIVVRGERSEFQLPVENPDEFPGIPEFAEESYFQVETVFFQELIRRTIVATDTDSSRFALGGVLLEFAADSLTAVATDGRRLAKMEGPLTVCGDARAPEQNTILPTRSLQLMSRNLEEGEQQVALLPRANNLVLKTPTRTIFSRLVEGRFPRWRDVLPDTKAMQRVELTVGPLFAAVRQAAIVLDKESKGIDFAFQPGLLVLSGRTANVGKTRVELPIAYEGEPVTLCLDYGFVADFLRVLEPTTSFTFHILDAESATLCETADGYSYVVMPLSRDHMNP